VYGYLENPPSTQIRKEGLTGKVLLMILCVFFPFLAALVKNGPCPKVLLAPLLQLLGLIPGAIHGIYQMPVTDRMAARAPVSA
jgi:uncharacterized membrane protein YqaE (UPF0057 family)